MVRVGFSYFSYWLVGIKLVFGVYLAAAQGNALLPYVQEERWGYVNSRIEWIIRPQFLSASSFQQGVATVKVDDSRNSWQILLTNGKFLLDEPVEKIQLIDNNLFAIWKNSQMGILNISAQWVFPPQFINTLEEGTQLRGNLLCARTATGIGIISLAGEWLLQPQYEFVVIHSVQLAEVKKNGIVSLYHLGSKQVVADSLESIGVYACGRLPVRKNKRWGILNDNGNWVQKPVYKQLFTYTENLAAALLQESWGFLDTAGNWAIQPKYQLVRSFSEGKAAACYSGKWGFINQHEEWVMDPTYAEAFSFKENLALVKFQKKWYFLNPNGFTPIQLTVPLNETALTPASGFQSNFFLFQTETGKYQYLTKSGSLLIPAEFDDAEPFVNGLALIRLDNQSCYLTSKGIILR